MKHLKKYENINQNNIIYFIAPVDSNKPWEDAEYRIKDFNYALDVLENYNKKRIYRYGIFEVNVNLLSEKEIEFRKKVGKYNL